MDEQAVPVVSYARISADTARDEHGVADSTKSTRRLSRQDIGRLRWRVSQRTTHRRIRH